eukprot:9465818-Pyramimonas_sp.AAC.1
MSADGTVQLVVTFSGSKASPSRRLLFLYMIWVFTHPAARGTRDSGDSAIGLPPDASFLGFRKGRRITQIGLDRFTFQRALLTW